MADYSPGLEGYLAPYKEAIEAAKNRIRMADNKRAQAYFVLDYAAIAAAEEEYKAAQAEYDAAQVAYDNAAANPPAAFAPPKTDEDKIAADAQAAADAAAAEAAGQKKADEDAYNAQFGPTAPPSESPTAGYEWYWDGDRWAQRPTSKTKESPEDVVDSYDEVDDEGNTWHVEVRANGSIFRRKVKAAPKKPESTRPSGEVPKDPYGRTAEWDEDDGQWRYPPDWGQNPNADAEAKARYDAEIKAQEEKDRLERERQERLDAQAKAEAEQRRIEAERQYGLQTRQFEWSQGQATQQAAAEREKLLASKRANPQSWLEYSMLSNQTPAVQPWMLPLMPQQYWNIKPGQGIPGWNPQAEGGGLPGLTDPSMQYYARIGPTAQQQWGGYQQMQSGAPFEESLFRLKSQAAPGSGVSGLNWLR